ncbi:MAG: hypothetical protein EVA65_02795 [Oceanococcus sp.]|nr:MAG: hypothetical protein EVA65_02795 [Oceanococcus sp.]
MAKQIFLAVLACSLAACQGGRTATPEHSSTYQPLPLGPDAPFVERVDHDAELDNCVLYIGTMGIPDPLQVDFLPDIGGPLLDLVSPPPADFPEQIYLRTDTETFNRKYQFVLHEGNVWYKHNTAVTGVEDDWTQVYMPNCLAGTLIGISADDDELIAIRKNGDIYGLDNVLKDPLLFNWTSRWGTPVWLGTGYHIQEDYLSWSWTVISNSEDKNWTDTAGNLHRVGDGKVSHIWMLRNGGQRYGYIDPWLAKDESYEACGPLRGRFKGINLNSSGSTLITINRYGDIFTRHYDFDLAGVNEVFFQYAFEDQSEVRNPKIQLPSFEWVQQPKVPGQITHIISIHKVGENMQHRVMRIEGLNQAGETGYWEKEVEEMTTAAWQFVATGNPLRGTLLDNRPGDTSMLDIGDNEDQHFARNLTALPALNPADSLETDADWAAEMTDFNFYCSPTTLRIHTSVDEHMDLTLHVVDVIRQTPRERGLDDNPRKFRGNIEIPDALLAMRDELSPRQRAFIDLYLDGNKFTDVRMSGVSDSITLTPSGRMNGFSWTFERTPNGEAEMAP